MIIRPSWGTGIAMAYTAFVLATTGFVVFAMRRPLALVRPDYYAESLRQDQRMRAAENARGLGADASIVQTSSRELLVSLPRAMARTASGTVTLYRASDAGADRVLALALTAEGHQRMSLRGLATGRWVVQLRWSTGGLEYYVEQQVTVR